MSAINTPANTSLSEPITAESCVIRRIEQADNTQVAAIVRRVLEEHAFNKPGTAYFDPELDDMFSHYQGNGQCYLVAVHEATQRVMGGGGYSRLKGTKTQEGLCELQKVYFLPDARGLGLGKKLLEALINQATRDGYQSMYLESAGEFANAVGLYEHLGFSHLDKHKGDTGHQGQCSIYMSRPLMRL